MSSIKNRRKSGRIPEAGGSGYTAAFTHPDPLDSNDRVRQKTQARAGNFPYDRPTSYGGPIGTDMGGASYQRPGDVTPPNPRHKRAGDAIPYGQYGRAWEQLESMLGTYTPGEQADDALSLGYGSHGRRMGEMDDDGIDIDSLKHDLMPSFCGIIPHAPDFQDLMGLLMQLSSDNSSETGGEADDMHTNDDWSGCVYAPGAENDPI